MKRYPLLDLDYKATPIEIKRAYAVKVKTCHPEEFPEAFMNLRKEYENAIKNAKRQSESIGLGMMQEQEQVLFQLEDQGLEKEVLHENKLEENAVAIELESIEELTADTNMSESSNLEIIESPRDYNKEVIQILEQLYANSFKRQMASNWRIVIDQLDENQMNAMEKQMPQFIANHFFFRKEVLELLDGYFSVSAKMNAYHVVHIQTRFQMVSMKPNDTEEYIEAFYWVRYWVLQKMEMRDFDSIIHMMGKYKQSSNIEIKTEAIRFLGIANYYLKLYSEAIICFEELKSVKKYSDFSYWYLGLSLMHIKDFKNSQLAFNAMNTNKKSKLLSWIGLNQLNKYMKFKDTVYTDRYPEIKEIYFELDCEYSGNDWISNMLSNMGFGRIFLPITIDWNKQSNISKITKILSGIIGFLLYNYFIDMIFINKVTVVTSLMSLIFLCFTLFIITKLTRGLIHAK